MIPIVFLSLVAIFIFIISIFFVSTLRELLVGSFFLLPFIAFFLLGTILLYLIVKKRVKGKLRRFLILTSIAAIGFLLSIILHNFFYAATMMTSKIPVLPFLFEILHAIFFFLAIPLCPLVFLVGAMGTALQFMKKKKLKNNLKLQPLGR
ncbi:MAG: hypothetical protein PVJ09_02010 [Candidatus Woesebacteria bacterium]